MRSLLCAASVLLLLGKAQMVQRTAFASLHHLRQAPLLGRFYGLYSYCDCCFQLSTDDA